MSRLSRWGGSLVELLIALLLAVLLAAALHRTVVLSLRAYQSQAQRIEVQQNLRAAASLLPAELRELHPAEDVLAISADSIRLRAMRQLAFLCAPAALGVRTTLTLAREPAHALRQFNPLTDSALVYSEDDNRWHAGKIEDVASGSCATVDGWGGHDAVVLAVRFAPGTGSATVIPVGTPVRGFEVLTYRSYAAGDGRQYVGQRSSGDLQPLIGPVTPGGLAFRYRDSTGRETNDPARVRLVEIRVRGASTLSHASLSVPVDSVALRVALRGSPR